MRISDWSSDVCSSDLPSVMQGIDLALDRVTGIIDLAYDRLLPHAQTLLFYTIVIEIALLFLLYAFGRQETIADLIKKMVVISLFVWLIRDWQQIGRASSRERVCQYV